MASMSPKMPTWQCACEKVQIKMESCVGAPIYSNGDCFCDDCNIRTRVAMDKFKELNAGNDAVDMMNAFAPNGAVQISGFSTATATIIKGADQIGYFRSGTLRGKEWTKKSLNGANAATLYCTSCGTWIGFHGPGNLLETNSLGLTNWQRVEGKNGAQTILFWTSFEDVTGVKIPDGVKKAAPVYGVLFPT
eukprot:CAMPEP_0171606402 /NCGR_PEP_ID=MMETSP0990-20121206/7744_1 /TAXON_ID=483369 /ORGANISM="non described non described, Strain CCMP2098" /LENGTH=190 /DNA_ID=CAMNT_0012169237 /DNA_START=777 /DNA_END=1348 /DNA_ORIENTATION=-